MIILCVTAGDARLRFISVQSYSGGRQTEHMTYKQPIAVPLLYISPDQSRYRKGPAHHHRNGSASLAQQRALQRKWAAGPSSWEPFYASDSVFLLPRTLYSATRTRLQRHSPLCGGREGAIRRGRSPLGLTRLGNPKPQGEHEDFLGERMFRNEETPIIPSSHPPHPPPRPR